MLCPMCQGEGSHSRAVERDGGGFTASEWADEDPEFREDYLAGVYDASCEECGGAGRLPNVDAALDALAKSQPETVASIRDSLEADASYAAERDAERRAGC